MGKALNDLATPPAHRGKDARRLCHSARIKELGRWIKIQIRRALRDNVHQQPCRSVCAQGERCPSPMGVQARGRAWAKSIFQIQFARRGLVVVWPARWRKEGHNRRGKAESLWCARVTRPVLANPFKRGSRAKVFGFLLTYGERWAVLSHAAGVYRGGRSPQLGLARPTHFRRIRV